MNTIVKVELFKATNEVNFYSVKIGTAETDFDEVDYETDKFLDKFSNQQSEYYDEFTVIIALIEEMGKRGAKHYYFRHERRADALPSKPNAIRSIVVVEHSKLRLYCIRLNDECVVLCNGGVKTKNNPEDCANVKVHFRFANRLARAIDEAIKNKEVKIIGRLLELEYDELSW